MSADLVRFIEARIAEDEAAGTWGQGCITVADPAPRISIDPARVLRQCEAFRRIVGQAERSDSGWWEDNYLRALASIWADHPEFRKEWAA